ncbi:MAG: hypothetical protein HY391_00845, partial [Deltaproteobacteria bacterium]|nr:hypothetical protein [Deltaproteobacteria bacterium]
IEGFLKRGKSKVHFVEDVSKAIYPEKSARLIEGWKARGVEVTRCQNVVSPRIIKLFELLTTPRKWVRF